MITLWDCNPALDNYSYQFSSVIYLLNKFNSKCQRYVKLRYGIRFSELMIIYFSSHLSSACMGSVLAYFFSWLAALIQLFHETVSMFQKSLFTSDRKHPHKQAAQRSRYIALSHIRY